MVRFVGEPIPLQGKPVNTFGARIMNDQGCQCANYLALENIRPMLRFEVLSASKTAGERRFRESR